MTQPTVKVRIAVAVDPEGAWSAIGWRGCRYDSVRDVLGESSMLDALDPGEQYCWVTAEVPVPAVLDIAGVVEEKTDA